MVIAHRHDHTAIGGRACHIGVAHHITRTVHTGPLPVPQAKDTVVFAFAAQLGLLTAPECGRGQILVQSGLKRHLRGFQHITCTGHLHINGTQRRPAIAGHIACGIQTRLFVTRALHQHQAYKRLCAVQQNLVFVKVISIIERHILM